MIKLAELSTPELTAMLKRLKLQLQKLDKKAPSYLQIECLALAVGNSIRFKKAGIS